MLYYINCNGREFPLALAELAPTGSSRLTSEAGGREVQVDVEVLSRPERDRPALVLVDGAVYRVRSAPQLGGRGSDGGAAPRRTIINGQPVTVTVETELQRRARPIRNKDLTTSSRITAPMPGRIVKVNVRVGDRVAAGDPLLGIEAMKMENEVLSPSAGQVSKLDVEVGATVEADQELIVIDPV